MINDIEEEILRTQSVLDDFRENKLPFNIIETEGFLRGLKTMLNMFKEFEPDSEN